MIRCRKLIIICIIFFVFAITSCDPRSVPIAVGDCTHYVDNQTTTDGNGSLESPWDNIAGHVHDLAPGDIMCIRGDPSTPGRVYTEAEIHPTVSGISGNLITVKPYTGEHVIIQTTGTYALRLGSLSHYWLFEGFAFDRQSSWDADPVTRVVWIRNANHNIIRDCKVYNGSNGVYITSGDHNLIDNCQIYDNGTGMFLNGGTGNTVSNCTIYDNRGDGIQCYNGPDALVDAVIENNHIYTTLGKCSENAIDVKQGNVIIRGNVMHGFRYCDASCGGSGGGYGEAIIGHMSIGSLIIEDCEIYNCSSGIVIRSNDDPCYVRRNLIHNMVDDFLSIVSTGMHLEDNDDVVHIHNNTFHGLPDHILYFYIGANADLKNNLFAETHSTTVNVSATIAHDYNGWFNASQVLFGFHDTIGNDPLLTANYYLTENSPARGTGEDDVDLGAFSYEASTGEEWWEHCTPCPIYPIQPTYTSQPIPTCRPCESPTPYPISTSYPIQPGG